MYAKDGLPGKCLPLESSFHRKLVSSQAPEVFWKFLHKETYLLQENFHRNAVEEFFILQNFDILLIPG